MNSCLDDEYWQQWRWLQPDTSGVVISDDVTSHEGDSSAEHVSVHDNQSDEAEEVEAAASLTGMAVIQLRTSYPEAEGRQSLFDQWGAVGPAGR